MSVWATGTKEHRHPQMFHPTSRAYGPLEYQTSIRCTLVDLRENESFDQSRNGKWSHHTGPTRSLTAFLPIYLPGTHSFMLNFRPALSFEDHSPRAKTGVLEGRFLNGSEGQRFAFTWISVCTSCCPVTFAHRALAVSSMLSQHFSPREVYLFLMGKPATTTSLATEFYCRAWTLPDSFLQIFLPRDPHDSRPSTSYNEISL